MFPPYAPLRPYGGGSTLVVETSHPGGRNVSDSFSRRALGPVPTTVLVLAGLALIALGAYLTLGRARTSRGTDDDRTGDDYTDGDLADVGYVDGRDDTEDAELLTRRMHRERDAH